MTLPVAEKNGTLKILKYQKIYFQIFLASPVAEKKGTLKIMKNQKKFFPIFLDMTSGGEKKVHWKF